MPDGLQASAVALRPHSWPLPGVTAVCPPRAARAPLPNPPLFLLVTLSPWEKRLPGATSISATHFNYLGASEHASTLSHSGPVELVSAEWIRALRSADGVLVGNFAASQSGFV